MKDRTERILDVFVELNTIPRCSKNEKAVAAWLRKWADERGFAHRTDSVGNLVVNVPASTGCEDRPAVIIQGHMDMVCEKTPESTHDFEKDAIPCLRREDWMTSRDTTLGADNGIAIAYALCLAEEKSLHHPPLELLFTVDEESGLSGVKNLSADLIAGKTLINLDSEDEGVFTIGCAGGTDTAIQLDFQPQSLDAQCLRSDLVIGGLKGGHSGIDIQKQRANANKLLARMLDALASSTAIQLIDIKGGSRHNAIPRDAQAVIAYAREDVSRIQRAFDEERERMQADYCDVESDLRLRFGPSANSAVAALSPDDTRKCLLLLTGLPNGVAGMSLPMPGMVETSCNLATVSLENGRLNILVSQRSSSARGFAQIKPAVAAVARLAGAQVADRGSYPAWQPDMNSSLLQRSKKVYQDLFRSEPVIQVIHAGLECAIIGGRIPGMDMISFGPTIRNPHSPDERLYIPSVQKVWCLLSALLEDYAR